SYLFALSQPLSTVLFLFFFLLLRPPRSPLFPYTTLFRSRLVEALHHGRLSDGVRHVFGLRGLDQFPVLRRRQIDRNVVAVGGRTDRKSTRLNSSHVSISYAVFCLKKKNRTVSNDAKDRVL